METTMVIRHPTATTDKCSGDHHIVNLVADSLCRCKKMRVVVDRLDKDGHPWYKIQPLSSTANPEGSKGEGE